MNRRERRQSKRKKRDRQKFKKGDKKVYTDLLDNDIAFEYTDDPTADELALFDGLDTGELIILIVLPKLPEYDDVFSALKQKLFFTGQCMFMHCFYNSVLQLLYIKKSLVEDELDKIRDAIVKVGEEFIS